MHIRPLVLVVVAAAAWVVPARAAGFLLPPEMAAEQSVLQVTLPPPDAELQRGFTALTSVRELSDGRVILTDPREQVLVVADLGTQEVRPISRRGDGPGEYTVPVPVYPLAADTSIMLDPFSARWLIFDDTEVIGTRTVTDPAVRAFSSSFPYGIDTRGKILTSERGTSADSSRLVLFFQAPIVREEIALLRGALSTGPSLPARIDVYEKAFLASDGWVAVARLDPYRVDWRTPDGSWIHGPPLPVPSEPLRGEDRDLLDPRGAHRSANWPTVLPPFPAGWELLPSPDGLVLIRRTPSTQHPYTRYDAVNRRGELEIQIRLGENESILGFGQRTVYTVMQDAVGLQYLRRHQWIR